MVCQGKLKLSHQQNFTLNHMDCFFLKYLETLNIFSLIDYPIHLDTISFVFKGDASQIFYKICISIPNILIFASSTDADETPPTI